MTSRLSILYVRAKQLGECSRGTAAIEFAIVGSVFIFLLMGTIFLGLDHARAASMDGAVVGMSRQLTQSGSSSLTLNDLVASYCKQNLWPGKCDLTTLIVQAGPPDAAGFSDPKTSFADLQSGQLNVISVKAQKSMLDTLISRKFVLGSAYAVYVP